MKVEEKLAKVLTADAPQTSRHDIVLHHIQRAEQRFAEGRIKGRRGDAQYCLNNARDAFHGRKFPTLQRRVDRLQAQIDEATA